MLLDQLETDAHVCSSNCCREMDHRTQIWLPVCTHMWLREHFNLGTRQCTSQHICYIELPASNLGHHLLEKKKKLDNYCLLPLIIGNSSTLDLYSDSQPNSLSSTYCGPKSHRPIIVTWDFSYLTNLVMWSWLKLLKLSISLCYGERREGNKMGRERERREWKGARGD